MRIVEPTAGAFRATRVTAEFAPQDLRGKSVVFLNNGWQSMNKLVDEMRGTLVNEFGVAQVLEFEVPIAAAASEAVLQQATENADIAIVGLAN